MEISVGEIVVPSGRRVVNDEKVGELAGSISILGLLNPIVVTTSNRLVAGAHRLEAVKNLGFETIEANVVELEDLDIELAEIDENLVRFDLSPAERAKLTARRKAIYIAKYPETGHGKTPGAKGVENGGKVANLATLHSGGKPESFYKDTAAKSGGSTRGVLRDVQRGENIAEDVLDSITGTDMDNGVNLDALAKLDKREQKAVVKHDKVKGINNLKTAKRSLDKARVVRDIKEEPTPTPEGPFRVIVADPPWPYERIDDPTHRGSMGYPPMSIEDICDMAVEEMAHDDCILWLWTTNSFLQQAYEVVEAWGFESKTLLTWVKSKIGVGNWLRNCTEHCILAVRGKPVVQLTNQSTALRAPVREHSRKPIEFYKMVEKLCPGSKVELFAREKREGWESWGGEVDKFEES